MLWIWQFEFQAKKVWNLHKNIITVKIWANKFSFLFLWVNKFEPTKWCVIIFFFLVKCVIIVITCILLLWWIGQGSPKEKSLITLLIMELNYFTLISFSFLRFVHFHLCTPGLGFLLLLLFIFHLFIYLFLVSLNRASLS